MELLLGIWGRLEVAEGAGVLGGWGVWGGAFVQWWGTAPSVILGM